MSRGLAGLSVLVTRPSPQGERLCQRLRELRAEAWHLPTLSISAVGTSPALEQALAVVPRADWLVFISRNAVECGLALLGERQQVISHKTRIAAVGPATAATLAAHGREVSCRPSAGYTSEALLAEPALADVAGAVVVIFRGDGGRELLGNTLRARGAEVHYAEVYRRERPRIETGTVFSDWVPRTPRAVVVTSLEGMQNLLDMAPDRESLLAATVVVVSERIAAAARAAGFARVIEAPGPDDESVAAALALAF